MSTFSEEVGSGFGGHYNKILLKTSQPKPGVTFGCFYISGLLFVSTLTFWTIRMVYIYMSIGSARSKILDWMLHRVI